MYDHEPSRTEPLAAALIQALTTEQQLPVTDVPLAPDQQLRSLLEQQFAIAADSEVTATSPTVNTPTDAISAALDPSTINPYLNPPSQVQPMSTPPKNWKKISAIIAASFAGAAIAIGIFMPKTYDTLPTAYFLQDDIGYQPENGDRYLSKSEPKAATNSSEMEIAQETLDHRKVAPHYGGIAPQPQANDQDSSVAAYPAADLVIPPKSDLATGPTTTRDFLAESADVRAIQNPLGNKGPGYELKGHGGKSRELNSSSPTGQGKPGQQAPGESNKRFDVAKGERDNSYAGQTKVGAGTLELSKLDAKPGEKLAERETREKDAGRFKEVDELHALHDPQTNEQYEQLSENPFQPVKENPLSTFSIDVDTASYANCRRFLMSGQLPPPAAVRIEEFVNYFSYNYPQPSNGDPFSVQLEASACPWNDGNLLLHVGLKGKEIDRRERPASNLVFLVDVSGSMTDEAKLPLLRAALHQWTNELGPTDTVTIVTYAGASGLRLAPTKGTDKEVIHAAIETLQSGGSTNGSAGIELAYEKATEHFIKGGVNRILWATDGDLNVGVTSDDALVNLITDKAKSGVFLTVLGVGTGNLKDAKLEKMADKGNGIYAYLDTPKEARKVLIEQMSGSTITIAKDVKLQLEFNPAIIAGYRLVGYENRMLATQDFHDDKKDAGEIGAGHTVTAIYELIPTKTEAAAKIPGNNGSDPLKYQTEKKPELELTPAAKTGELLTVKLRYKQPEASDSVLREYPLKSAGGKFTAASSDMQFACCVAQFGMWLRNSQYRGEMQPAAFLEIAAANVGEDKNGSRKEFVELVKKAMELKK
jgi:Ca-activated chloride channel homolog